MEKIENEKNSSLGIDNFKNLSTDLVLASIEKLGKRCTGRLLQLNSMENRVFSVEIEDESSRNGVKSVIAKFYRPKRWTSRQIISEHNLQIFLSEEEIPTPKLFLFPNGQSLSKQGDFEFCVWEKVAGRTPLDLTFDNLKEIGQIVARMHNLFESKIEESDFDRPHLSSLAIAERAFNALSGTGHIPRFLESSVLDVIEELAFGLQWIDTCMTFIPTHGDLHRNNLMQTQDSGKFWVLDFDDCMWAPDIQDLWLLASGVEFSTEESEKGLTPLGAMIEGYSVFRRLPQGSEQLVEPLRTLRMLHYVGWIAHRWQGDPLFHQVFSFFHDEQYWEKTLHDFETQRSVLLHAGLMQGASE